MPPRSACPGPSCSSSEWGRTALPLPDSHEEHLSRAKKPPPLACLPRLKLVPCCLPAAGLAPCCCCRNPITLPGLTSIVQKSIRYTVSATVQHSLPPSLPARAMTHSATLPLPACLSCLCLPVCLSICLPVGCVCATWGGAVAGLGLQGAGHRVQRLCLRAGAALQQQVSRSSGQAPPTRSATAPTQAPSLSLTLTAPLPQAHADGSSPSRLLTCSAASCCLLTRGFYDFAFIPGAKYWRPIYQMTYNMFKDMGATPTTPNSILTL